MANAVYPLWKQALMREIDEDKSLDQGDINPANGVYVSLVNAEAGAYVYSDAHQFYSSISDVQGTPQLLTATAVVGRIFAAETAVFTNVTGTRISAIVLHRQKAGGDPTTWRLVLYEDSGITGLPMIPSGGNIIVTWNTQGIFGL